MTRETEDMTYVGVIKRLQQEKELVDKLGTQLEIELKLISEGDVQSLEESMPLKQKLIRSIAELREATEVPGTGPVTQDAKRIRTLQQELVGLWKKVAGLNDLSKQFVSQRLSEIEAQIEIFFTGLKDGYTRDGKKSAISAHTLKAGV